MRTHPSRGVTLVEVTIVMVMASLVMVGLVGFYLNSQTTWLLASSKAIAQREGTMALERIAQTVRGAATVTATAVPDADHMRLDLSGGDLAAPSSFAWMADSLVHWNDQGTDRGALTLSRVVRFQVLENDSLVQIVHFDVLDPNGEVIELSTAAAVYNRP